MGLAEVPVIPCDDMSEEDIRAFRLSVNRMGELAEWDEELLRRELETLDAGGEDLAVCPGGVSFPRPCVTSCELPPAFYVPTRGP